MVNYFQLKEKQRYAFNYVIPALVRQNFLKKASNIASCGHWKEIAHCQNCGTNYLSGFNTCKERFCPVCELKRSRLWFAKLVPIVEDLLSQGFYLNMLTLTIPDMPSLKDNLDCLMRTWRYMVGKSKGISSEFKKRFLGGIRCLEVKKGENSKLWHCHFHCIVIKSVPSRDFEFILQAWSRAYQVVTGTKINCNIDIRAFKFKSKEELLKNVLECCKYVSKFEWHIDDSVKELIEAMKGIRSVSSWGFMKAQLKEDSVEHDMDKTLAEVQDLFCEVCGSKNFDFLDGPHIQKMIIKDFEKEQIIRWKK